VNNSNGAAIPSPGARSTPPCYPSCYMQLRFALFMIAAAALAGCSKDPSIIGDWDSALGTGSGPKVLDSFKKDGTYSSLSKIGKRVIVMDGTWRMDGDDLLIDASGSDADTETGAVRDLPRYETRYKVTWQGDDKVLLTDSQGSYVLTRNSQRP
jgi:hypothetical protein